MKSINYLVSIFALSAFLFSACDIVEGPRTDGNNGGPGDTTKNVQKVLLEYFTGHKCGNCPEQAAQFPTFENTFGEQFIFISVHAGSLAEPSLNPDPNAKYKYDFRTSVGNEIYTDFNLSGVPNGLVNRSEYNGSVIQSAGAWASAIQQHINTEPVAKLDVNNSYDEVSGVISTDVKTTFLKEKTATMNLVVYVIEDKIVKWQKDYTVNPQDLPDYEHKNVLRGSMNNTYGDQIANGTVDAGTELFNQFTYNSKTQLDSTFNVNNSYTVTFVMDDATKEILQVEKTKVN
ncbi:MAG: Omp28-related outer membrane protein [Bacteroidia bacterium]|nr:Omp28-related outer membrane protein [Bacteroidia bacterium]